MLWHDWDTESAAALDRIIAEFGEIYPDVEVVPVAVPPDEFVAQFTEKAKSGFGPDLILADTATIYELAEAGFLQDLAGREGSEAERFLSTGYLQLISKDNKLYGLPMSNHTQVLFYDRERVSVPVTTTEELFAAAQNGQGVAMDLSLPATFWLLGTEYGEIVSTEGVITLEQGGNVNWLQALQSVDASPGFIVGHEQPEMLQQALIDGDVAYLVGDSRAIRALREGMGADRFGMTTLPRGHWGTSASPILYTDGLAIYSAASTTQSDLAYELARFMTSTQQQLRLATDEIGRAPVVSGSNVFASLPSTSLIVASQSRMAQVVPYALRPYWAALVTPTGDFATGYKEVLSGTMSPISFLKTRAQSLAEQFGLRTLDTQAFDASCPASPGRINVWHTFGPELAMALSKVVDAFEQACVGNEIELLAVPYGEVVSRLEAAAAADQAPEALFISSRWIPQMVDRNLLRELDDLVPVHSLQNFILAASRTMVYNEKLYGIPETLLSLALYVNTDLSYADPPLDLENLLAHASDGLPMVMPLSFYYGFWGMAPFGGFEYDSYTNNLSNTEGLVDWLYWLKQNQNYSGINLTFSAAEATEAFVSGKVAYMVNGPWALPQVQEHLGSDGFGVVSLPLGPEGPAQPMLQTEGIVVSAGATAEETTIALAFAWYLALESSVRTMIDAGGYVPAGVMLELNDQPAINGFREQAFSTRVMVENTNFARMEDLASGLYESVLIDGVDPQVAVDALVDAVNSSDDGN